MVGGGLGIFAQGLKNRLMEAGRRAQSGIALKRLVEFGVGLVKLTNIEVGAADKLAGVSQAWIHLFVFLKLGYGLGMHSKAHQAPAGLKGKGRVGRAQPGRLGQFGKGLAVAAEAIERAALGE